MEILRGSWQRLRPPGNVNGNVHLNVNGKRPTMDQPSLWRSLSEAPSCSRIRTGGTYHEAQTVAISSTTPNPTIHFTLNGTEPTVASPVHTAPVNIATTTTMKAFTVAPGFLDSDVAMALYTILPFDDNR